MSSRKTVAKPLVRPFIKWAGGKRQLMPELIKYVPKKYNSYYEPFIGGGALLFELQPKKATISDKNEDLIKTYISVRDEIDELIELLKMYEGKNNGPDYYKIRSMDRDITIYSNMRDVEKAARLIYLNKTCYNGLYRVNSQGLFNTPFGNYTNPAICDEYVLRAVSNYLNGNDIEILQTDFEKTIETASKDDFVYFDPPYDSPDNTNFTGYQSGGFDREEQKRLKNVYEKLTEGGVYCTLSNSSTDFIHDLYKNYKVKKVKCNRAINSNGNDRGAVDEVIVSNW
ncbi:DNA adenine methylase [Candidatus Methanarcanum hacksteinii]|uniref:DNA adenine methylase n=1 Tax=Candidatus Methanarcanum hacksteinii TaxID=2911857 RepID=UPI0037DD05FF